MAITRRPPPPPVLENVPPIPTALKLALMRRSAPDNACGVAGQLFALRVSSPPAWGVTAGNPLARPCPPPVGGMLLIRSGVRPTSGAHSCASPPLAPHAGSEPAG